MFSLFDDAGLSSAFSEGQHRPISGRTAPIGGGVDVASSAIPRHSRERAQRHRSPLRLGVVDSVHRRIVQRRFEAIRRPGVLDPVNHRSQRVEAPRAAAEPAAAAVGSARQGEQADMACSLS